jgi:hypothetical protein
MMLAIIPVAAVAGAFGRRIAGGVLSQWCGVDQGTQVQRVIWGLLMGLVALAARGPPGTDWHAWLVLPGVAFGIWAGSCVFAFRLPWCADTGLQVGRVPGRAGVTWSAWWYDQAALLWHGCGGVLLPALLAWWLGLTWWWLAIAGALCGPCYELAYDAPMEIPWLGCLHVDPPPTAELLWGALVGVAMALSYSG